MCNQKYGSSKAQYDAKEQVEKIVARKKIRKEYAGCNLQDYSMRMNGAQYEASLYVSESIIVARANWNDLYTSNPAVRY